MADVRIPNDIATWITARNWGAHHDQWHWERRWDYWEALLSRPTLPPNFKNWIESKFEEANTKGWARSDIQEGQAGNGEEFLFMHRAMIEVIIDEFPHHMHFFRGWHTPPIDHESALDPVNVPDPELTQECAPKRRDICAAMLGGIARIESDHDSFRTDDDFGLFVETSIRPTSADPLARSSDSQTGIHNYLHGRWSGLSTDLDLSDPRFNVFNTRFWRLHGWIDHQWWLFRLSKGFDDADADYRAKINHYRDMMSQSHEHDHHHEMGPMGGGADMPRGINAFADVLAEIE